jgi:hypothetical protein
MLIALNDEALPTVCRTPLRCAMILPFSIVSASVSFPIVPLMVATPSSTVM